MFKAKGVDAKVSTSTGTTTGIAKEEVPAYKTTSAQVVEVLTRLFGANNFKVEVRIRDFLLSVLSSKELLTGP